jgi:hypothetical protein
MRLGELSLRLGIILFINERSLMSSDQSDGFAYRRQDKNERSLMAKMNVH